MSVVVMNVETNIWVRPYEVRIKMNKLVLKVL